MDKIVLLPSIARGYMRENVIAVVINSHTGFSQIVVVTETSYQMVEVLSFCDREWA